MPDGSDASPLFAVVIPVHNAAPYLASCLDSVLAQSFGAFEVVLIDDASTDDSLAVARRYAERDARISIVALEHNVGVSQARNTGMERARADYLLFVDSDDALVLTALQVIADRIEQTGHPDVVMYGHARSYPDGRLVADPKNALLDVAGPADAATRRALLKLISAPWNKACRRDYVRARDFTFPDGLYEDLPWSYQLIMTADVLATAPQVCYLYRQTGQTSRLGATGRAHFDLIDQYDRIFAYLDEHPELESWRAPMLDRLAWHIPTVLETSSRIRPADRRAFFRASAAAMQRHRPADYRPSGRLGLKVWLLLHGGYPLFRAAQQVNRMRRLGASGLRRIRLRSTGPRVSSTAALSQSDEGQR